MRKLNNSPEVPASVRRSPPVRIKVFGADGKVAKVHPPDGWRIPASAQLRPIVNDPDELSIP